MCFKRAFVVTESFYHRHLSASNSVKVELNFIVAKLSRTSLKAPGQTQSLALALRRLEPGSRCSCCVTNTSLFLEALSARARLHAGFILNSSKLDLLGGDGGLLGDAARSGGVVSECSHP